MQYRNIAIAGLWSLAAGVYLIVGAIGSTAEQ